MTNNDMVKVLQASVYICGLITLIFAFNLKLFLIGLFLGWILFPLGVSLCLHKWSSHKTFEPKNKLIKIFLLWCGTITCFGSTICWASTHRSHHKHSDNESDPHSPKNINWLKLWFYYFPSHEVNPRIVKDLINDKEHKWFHKNYYAIILITIGLIGLIDPLLVGYLFCIPVMYIFQGISYIIVTAHLPKMMKYFKGYRNFNTNDNTYNSQIINCLYIGEGYHNNHHAKAGLWNNAIKSDEYDLSAPIIKLLKK
jgi:stearoyl-CoA desaturase (delta-9 desaturase)